MTVLTDKEAMINSRPLTYIGDDIRGGRIITPALLAIGKDLERLPDNPPKKADVSLSERYRYQQRLLVPLAARILAWTHCSPKVDKRRNSTERK